MNSVYITAAVLDPRFKQPSFLDDAKWNKAYTEVAQLADRTSALTAATGTDEPGGEAVKVSNICQKNRKPTKRRRFWCCCAEMRKISILRNQVWEAQKKLKTIFRTNQSWLWTTGVVEKNQDSYPSLARGAKQLLCIPATSTPSECVFSKAGFIVNKSRSLSASRERWYVSVSRTQHKIVCGHWLYSLWVSSHLFISLFLHYFVLDINNIL